MILGKYNTEQSKDFTPFVGVTRDYTYYVSETLLPDSTDISSIDNWNLYGMLAGADYLMVRLEIKSIHDTLGFSNLTDDEKDICGLYNCVDDLDIVPYYMGQGMSQEEATIYHMDRVVNSKELNDYSCEKRFKSKLTWYPILLTYYDLDEATSIIDSVRNYLNDYINFSLFGTLWGSAAPGLLDFINGTGGVIVKLEDYTLRAGASFEDAKSNLTKYFYR